MAPLQDVPRKAMMAHCPIARVHRLITFNYHGLRCVSEAENADWRKTRVVSLQHHMVSENSVQAYPPFHSSWLEQEHQPDSNKPRHAGGCLHSSPRAVLFQEADERRDSGRRHC